MKNTFGADDQVIPLLFPANVVRWLESQGYQRQEMIEGTGLEAEEIDSTEVLITLHQHHQIFLNVLRITDNPHIGLHFGRQVRFTNLGFVGYAAISSANLREGMQAILKYLKLRSPLFQTEMYEQDQRVHIIYSEALNLKPVRQFIYEVLLSCAPNIFDFFGIEPLDKNNQQTQERIIRVTIPKPDDWDKHKHLLDTNLKVMFDQEITELIFPAQYLQQKSTLADPVTAKLAREICDEQLREVGDNETLVSRIIQIILSNPTRFPSLDEVASQICVSPRTLRRELKKLNTTYQTLLDDARKKMAIKLLKNTAMTVQEISEKLSFKDPTNFGRAFRKWTGKTPGSYRHQGKAE